MKDFEFKGTYKYGDRFHIMFIKNTNREYEGEWGKNGFNNIDIRIENENKELLTLGGIEHDVIIMAPEVSIHSIDILKDFDYIRITFSHDVYIRESFDGVYIERVDYNTMDCEKTEELTMLLEEKE